jgi:hypothetical protein
MRIDDLNTAYKLYKEYLILPERFEEGKKDKRGTWRQGKLNISFLSYLETETNKAIQKITKEKP